ncbi:DUF1488 family protein [Variovorax paradoxus]|jgi:hypothetical protein|uniref:DUF1488 family protein n=1 Tax=Variovorax paradoxus TaxID=34073 RepID=UPI003395E24E
MSDPFINVEDHGEWLNFRYREIGSGFSIPVKISREALADHFGANGPSENLVKAYAQNQDAIHRKVREKMQPGVNYTPTSPLVLRTADF